MIEPSLDQFLRWSVHYKILPFYTEISLNKVDFFNTFKSITYKSAQTFLLDSAGSYPNGRYSFLPFSSPKKRFLANSLKEFEDQWRKLQDHLKFRSGPPLPKSFPPFYGGAVGFLSYDCGRFFEKGWKSSSPRDTLGVPLFEFGNYDDIISLDHRTNKAYVFSCLEINHKTSTSGLKALYKKHKEKLLRKVNNIVYETVKSPFIPLYKRGRHEIPLYEKGVHPTFPPLLKGDKGGFNKPANNRDWFINSVKKIKEYIASGDIYQANLTQRITMKFKGESIDYFNRLQEINPSPYSCFFRFPGYDIVSCSPELLLKKRGRIAETKPIAGTRPRGKDPVSDQKFSRELILNEKERAEHIMLLDLERNDLGRVCTAGSVRVTKKMAIEKYSHVMHIVSSMRGLLKAGEDTFAALSALFPGGTITGCPKVRCMEILDEIEPYARGPFFGSGGWIGYQGDSEFNLLIRTALINHNIIHVQCGSGIVADSDPSGEYEESLSKARALLEAL